MVVEVEALAEAITAIAALDPDTLTDGELHDTVVALQRHRARLAAVSAGLLARWDRRRVWTDDGSRSPAARLARDVNCAVSSAKVELRRARQLQSMPATAGAVADGRLSLDHVDLLGRADTASREVTFAEHEQTLVEQCAVVRFADAHRIVAYWCQRVDTELDNDDDGRGGGGEDADLHASTTIDGTVVIDGVLDPVGGAVFTGELDRIEHDLYLTDTRHAVVRTAGQRRAAALVEMATRSAAATADKRRSRPLFTVLLGDTTFAQLCELGNRHVVTPAQLVPWLDTADLETILFDGPSTIVSVSRRRSFTGAVRRAIETRDRHCQHPSGCDVPAARCDIDHIVTWAAGGVTSQFNGRLECPAHNRHHDIHDHHAAPHPERAITRLDELRARLRWRYHHHEADDTDPDPDHDVDVEAGEPPRAG